MPPIRPAGSAVNARPRVPLAGPVGPARKKTARPDWTCRIVLDGIRYRRSETTCFLSRESLWAVLRRIIGRLTYRLLLGNTITSVVGT